MTESIIFSKRGAAPATAATAAAAAATTTANHGPDRTSTALTAADDTWYNREVRRKQTQYLLRPPWTATASFWTQITPIACGATTTAN